MANRAATRSSVITVNPYSKAGDRLRLRNEQQMLNTLTQTQTQQYTEDSRIQNQQKADATRQANLVLAGATVFGSKLKNLQRQQQIQTLIEQIDKTGNAPEGMDIDTLLIKPDDLPQYTLDTLTQTNTAQQPTLQEATRILTRQNPPEATIILSNAPIQQQRRIIGSGGAPPPGGGDDDDYDGDSDKKLYPDDDFPDIEGGGRLEIRPPGRYGMRAAVKPSPDDIKQFNFSGLLAATPSFVRLNVLPEADPLLENELTKLKACPMDAHDCLFDHSIQTPFATTSTNYSKEACIPFCNQHLLSVFGIGLEFRKHLKMDALCKKRETKFGPFAVAKSYDGNRGHTFKKAVCIYPAVPQENSSALGAALSVLFSTRRSIQNLNLSNNIVNTFHYVFDSSDISIGDLCKPYDLLTQNKCNKGAFDVLATMIAFLIWGNSQAAVPELSIAPYVNNLEFILTVAKKLLQLNRMTELCNQSGYPPIILFMLKLFDYETTTHGLPAEHPTTLRTITGISALRNICQDEDLTVKFAPDINDDMYFRYKTTHGGKSTTGSDGGRDFVKPPTNATNTGMKKSTPKSYRISRSSLYDIADNCMGAYGYRGELSSLPTRPIPPIDVPPQPVPKGTPRATAAAVLEPGALTALQGTRDYLLNRAAYDIYLNRSLQLGFDVPISQQNAILEKLETLAKVNEDLLSVEEALEQARLNAGPEPTTDQTTDIDAKQKQVNDARAALTRQQNEYNALLANNFTPVNNAAPADNPTVEQNADQNADQNQ